MIGSKVTAGVTGRLVDVIIVVIVFFAAAITGSRFAALSGGKAFVEWETTPAVMMACGRGFSRPAAESPALVDFQMRRRPALSCADIADDRPVGVPFRVTLSERYGLYGAALALRVGGISWRSLDAYMGALFGLSMVFAYLLFRLVAGRLPALLGVVGLIYSGHLLALVTFRDYGKEPCFLGLWLTLGWLWRRSAAGVSRKILLPAAVGGAALGWSLGFRPDVLVCAPAFVAVIVLAVRGFRPRDLALKAAALGVMAATFVVAGWPVLSSMAAGGNNSAHVIALGLTTSFNRTLGLEPAPFDLGNTYSDGYAYVVIAAHAAFVQHEAQPVVFDSARYDALGLRMLGDVAARFPADVVTRALGATVQVLKYPFDPDARVADLTSVPFVPLPFVKSAGEAIGTVLDPLHNVVLWITLAVFVVVSMRDSRVGLAVGLLVLYFCGYSMLQFSRRHTFHLDVIGIGVVVIALDGVTWFVRRAIGYARSHAATIARPARAQIARMLAGAGAAVAAMAVVAAVVSGTRAWQQRHVATLLDRTLALQWQDLSAPVEPFAATVLRRGGVTAAWEVEYAANREQWSTAVLFRVPPPAFSREASASAVDWVDVSYLQVDVGGRGCSVPSVLVGLKYTGYAETAHREFTRVFEIQTVADSAVTRLLLPVYYLHGPYSGTFDGFAVPLAASPCVTAIRRATSTEAVPLPILVAVLAPTWRTSPLYERLKDLPEFTRLF